MGSWVLEIAVDRHPEPCWPGLWELEYPEDAGNPYRAYGVSNGDGEFFHLLRAMAWATTSGVRLVVGNYYRDQVADALGLPREAAVMTAWEYEVDEGEPDLAHAVAGYVKARACVPIRPTSDRWQSAHADKAGLFEISTFRQLSAVDLAIAGDASSEITLYCLPDANSRSALAAVLTGSEPPSADGTLRIAHRLIDLTQVRDLYSTGASRLLIHSRHDEERRLAEIAAAASSAWESYQRSVRQLRSFDDFHLAMKALTAPVLALSSP
jgi:hypothetical protein